MLDTSRGIFGRLGTVLTILLTLVNNVRIELLWSLSYVQFLGFLRIEISVQTSDPD